MDLSKNVIMPVDDYRELQASANNFTTKDRIVGALTSAFIMTAAAGAVTAGSFGWAKAMDWLEERRFQRPWRNS